MLPAQNLAAAPAEERALAQTIITAGPPFFRVCSGSCLPPISQTSGAASQHITATCERASAPAKPPRVDRGAMDGSSSSGRGTGLQSGGQQTGARELLHLPSQLLCVWGTCCQLSAVKSSLFYFFSCTGIWPSFIHPAKLNP